MGTPQKDSSGLSDLQRGVSSPADRLLDDRSSDPRRQPNSRARHIASVNMERKATGLKVVRDSSHRCWCTIHNCIVLSALLVLTSACTLLIVWCSQQSAELAEVKKELLLIHAQIDRAASSASAGTGVTTFQIEEREDLSDRAVASARDLFLGRVKRAANDEENKGKKRKGKKKGGKGGKCKCRGKRGKRGQQGPKGDRGPQGPPCNVSAPSDHSGNGREARHFWAHYTAPNLGELAASAQFSRDNPCAELFDGSLCGNKTFKISSKPTEVPLKFFKPTQPSPDVPVRQLSDGDFVVSKSGLYLLYATVTYYDSKFTQGYHISINGGATLKCFGGIDYIYSDKNDQFNKKQRSCTSTGVQYLKEGDVVRVVNLYSDAIIDISQDATFFGLVLLEPSPNDHHRHNHG